MAQLPLKPGETFGPYEVIAPLGSGGMGTVYHGRDTRLGRAVAIKVSHQRIPSAFGREARAIARLNHPNICTLYDIGPDYLVMEYIAGRTFRSLTDRPQPIDLVTRVGKQIAEGLAAAHTLGIVHRDIKPDNLLLRDDGLVKLLDFGLARPDTASAESVTDPDAAASRVIAGTPRYMSPEQARGEAPTSASDVFSFGLVLYELSTGVHPFAEHFPGGVLEAVINQPALAPNVVVDTLPPALNSLLLQMLDKSPAARPTADQVLASLEGMDRSTGDAELVQQRPRGQRLLIGRDTELATLHSALRAVREGTGVLVTVAGEAGLGKTSLAERFLEESSAQNCWIGAGRCSERLAGAEAHLPLLEALEALCARDASGAVSRTMRLLAPTWWLRIASNSEPNEPSRTPHATSQERLKMELAAFLTEASRIRPVVLLLDDLHWADLSTIELIGYLATHFTRMRVLLVGTYRPSDLSLVKHAFLQLKLDLKGRGQCREVPLEFLARDDVDAIIQQEYPRNEFSRDFATRVHVRTGGSPLFVVDVLRYFREQDAVREVGGIWETTAAFEAVHSRLPESVQSMIHRTVERLDEAERAVLVLGSVQGVEFHSGVIALAGELDAAHVEELLENVQRRHHIVEILAEKDLADGSPSLHCRFTHALYHNAIYATLRPTRRMQYSLATADAMLSLHGDDASHATLALLLETGRDWARAARYFLLAARRAAEVFANVEAHALAARGLENLRRAGDVPDRLPMELEFNLHRGFAATALKGYSDPEVVEAMSAARELCAQQDDRTRLASALFGLFTYYVVAADLDTAKQVAQDLLGLAGAQDDEATRVTGHAANGIALIHQGRLFEAEEELKRAVSLYTPMHHHEELLKRYQRDPGLYARSELSRVLWLRGHMDRALRYIEETVAQARGTADVHSLAFALVFETFVKQLRQDVAGALEAASTCIELCDRYAIAQERAWADPVLAWALVHSGQQERGLAALRRHRLAYHAAGARIVVPYFRGLFCDALLVTGRHEEALEVLVDGLTVSDTTGQRAFQSELERLYGDVILMQSNGADSAVAGAQLWYDRALQTAFAQGAPSLALRAATSRARSKVCEPDSEAASTLRTVLELIAEGQDTPDVRSARMILHQLSLQ